MSLTLLQALCLFVSLFATLALIGCVDYVYRLAKWWHRQRAIPRQVRVGELRGEVHLFEAHPYSGEVLGVVRVTDGVTDGER